MSRDLGAYPIYGDQHEKDTLQVPLQWLRNYISVSRDMASSLKPYFIVFMASACGLVLEIVAGRVLAPSIGVSLYTWTAIIGVVLAKEVLP